MGQFLYGFSTAHVQRFLLRSPRLRDLQGGSQLIEELCTVRFTDAMEAVGLTREDLLSSAAGGARVLSRDEEAVRGLYAIWPFLVDRLAPGIVVEQALLNVEQAGGMAAAQRELGGLLQASRTFPLCELPSVGPLALRDQRTGEPAVSTRKEGSQKVFVDRSSLAKHRTWESMKDGGAEVPSALDRRFLGRLEAEGYHFVQGKDSLAEGLTTEDNPYVGLIHADGNSVGAFIQEMMGGVSAAEAGERFKEFSSALKRATEMATQDATAEVLAAGATGEGRSLRARPLVLGGDDVTIFVAADLAFEFTKVFLEKFEQHTTAELGRALGRIGEAGLSACAGLAITKTGFPFDRAHELAETLCTQAKARAKQTGERTPSAMAFHRVTTSLPVDAETVLKRELSGPGARLTLEAYAVGDRAATDLPSFSALEALAAALPIEQQRGPVRELLSTLHVSVERAEEAFDRLCEIKRRRGGDRAADELVEVLEVLHGAGKPWKEESAGPPKTALLDAYVLRQSGHRAMSRTGEVS